MEVNKMRRMKLRMCMCLVIAFITMHQTMAANELVEKRKEISGEFKNVKANETLRIYNQFCVVTFNYWDKDEILLKAEVVGKAETEEDAQQVIDEINVDFLYENSTYHLKMTDTKGTNKTRTMTNMWTLFLPKNKLNLDIECGFCTYFIGDYGKDIKLRAKFSQVKIGDVSSAKVDAVSEFGDFTVGKAKTLNLDATFCPVTLSGRIEQVALKAKHCNGITLASVGEFTVSEVQFSDLNVKELSKSLKIDKAQHSKITVSNCSNKLDFVTVKGEFAPVNLTIPEDLPFMYDLSSNFGQVSFSPTKEKTCKNTLIERVNNRTHLTGACGKESQAKKTTITVETTFAGINIE